LKLNYKKYGEEGEHLIILHGLFGTLDNWNTLSKKFSESFQVIAFDARNHGKSEQDKQIDYTLMAKDLFNLLDDLKIEKAHILGHSMGGKTAMQFAINYPQKVDKLIVVDIAPKAYQNGHQIIFDAFKSLDFDAIKSRKDADNQLKPILTDFGVRQFILKNLGLNAEKKYFWKPAYTWIEAEYENIITKIDGTYSGTSLFIKGEKSRYIAANEFENIQQQFTHSALKTIENAGHWVHAENPKEFYKIVIEYLAP